MCGEGYNLSSHAHTHPLTHTYVHIHTLHTYTRLSPELYDNMIRLSIPISSGELMMIGVLPMYPSPHASLFAGG